VYPSLTGYKYNPRRPSVQPEPDGEQQHRFAVVAELCRRKPTRRKAAGRENTYNNPHPNPDPNAPNDPSIASATAPPQQPLYTMQRMSCQASDLPPVPAIQWPII